MTVSVVMPVFNRAHIVRDAIASVLSQTHQDFELLVVDDGSTDDTFRVVKGFSDSRIHCFRHGQNRGISAARNYGLREARGSLVSFLDSDDVWKPTKLQTDCDFLGRHPEAGGVFTDLEKKDGDKYLGSFMSRTPYFSRMLAARGYVSETVFSKREMYLCLLHELPIKPSALTLRIECCRKIGLFNEEFRSGEDWEYLLRLSQVVCLGYINEAHSVLRVQNDSWHRIHGVAAKPCILEMLRRELLAANGDLEIVAAAKWGVGDISKHLAWGYLAAGKKREAARTFLRAYRETGNMSMPPRALFVFFPRFLRASLKRITGRHGD